MDSGKLKIIFRNIGAVVLGVIVGAMVNMGIIMISGSIIPPPEGTDLTTPEGIAKAMPLMEKKHFIMPFLAHALGTFAGALLAAYVAISSKMGHALIIGLVFLAGGITMVLDLPSPYWFNALDLVLAYIPMAFIAGKIAIKKGK